MNEFLKKKTFVSMYFEGGENVELIRKDEKIT